MYTTEEACFIVEEYIYSLTKQRVVVNLNRKIDPRLPKDHPMYQTMMISQLRLLNNAFLQASEKMKID